MHTESFVSKTHTYTQARSNARLAADFPVYLRSGELRVDDHVIDVSEMGIGIRTHRPLAPMQLVSMELRPPHASEPIEVLGRVMWATAHRMGIRFEQSDPRLSDAIWRLRQDYERI